jgi:pimeloyl-ACP methyl ester carboxylesterase
MSLMRVLRNMLPGVVLLLLTAAPARAQAPVPGACLDGTLPNGALSKICVPSSGWNGALLVYAHGYIAFNEPLDFQHLELPDGTNLPTLVQQLGFAFATTSYRQNGLAILEGSADILELLDAFTAAAGAPQRTYLAGVSEGGIIAALLAERAPERFTGVLSTCGPIGSFRGQITYVGDFRVLFDLHFPGLLPGSPIAIPDDLIANWETQYAPAIAAAVRADPARALQLVRVARAAYDPANFDTVVETIIGVLWYNVFGTNDAMAKLGGNPYDNRSRWYSGTSADLLLNLLVPRYTAAPAAVAAMSLYETSGQVTLPLVTLHTIGDEIIPYAHEILYRAKAQTSGAGRLVMIPVYRYGHCSFTTTDVLSAFFLLLVL